MKVAVIPARGGKQVLELHAGVDELKNHPLQLIQKSTFTLSNRGGHLIGNWKATFRNIVTDESEDGEATSLCKKKSESRVDCFFESQTGMVLLRAKGNTVMVDIPIGQGLQFMKKAPVEVSPDDENIEAEKNSKKKKDDLVPGEYLLGADPENNHYEFSPKKR